MNKYLLVCLMVLSLALNVTAASLTDEDIPEKKQTVLGLYVTAQEAFTQWHSQPDTLKILDVRTPGEYVFVGHAAMAANIPIKSLATKFDSEKKKPVMPENKNFVEEVKKRFKTTDTIMVMCRSGGRSAIAVNLLAEAGFKNVYNIIDGFEGDALDVPGSYNNGKRLVNGWKNSGAPWTYEVDPKLMYLTE
jgi:rhodanese-related sulfurtransferase